MDCRHPRVVSVFSVALALILAQTAKTDVAANHADGNMPWSVNYQIVENQLRVCDQSAGATAQQIDQAVAIWNSGLERTIASQSCDNAGVNVYDVAEGDCSEPGKPNALACGAFPTQEEPQVLSLRLEPDAYDYDGLVSILAHELGHNLGFGHASPCPNTLMNPDLCDPPL